MKIRQRLFDEVLVLEPAVRTDICGSMTDLSPDQIREAVPQADWKVQRLYTMPERHTFFGIHYQKSEAARGKLISVVQGKALDYIVDLRPDSKTYKQYKSFELNADTPLLVFIPAGFGHGFLTLEDNTIQAFAIDEDLGKTSSGIVNYKDPEIGLKLPVEDIIISDYDKNAN